MIVGILNGYYRSGTTIWMRIVAESNPHLATLSEPTSPIVVDQIRTIGFDGVEPLHGFKLFQGYGKLIGPVWEEYKKRWKEVFSKYKVMRGIMTSWRDVKYLLEPFHACEQPIFIKSTQLHLFLKNIEDEFQTKCLHLKRDLADCIAAHLAQHVLKNENEAKNILTSPQRPTMFFVDCVHENLKEYFNIDYGAKNVLEKLICNISVCNKVAEMSGVKTVNFESFDEVRKAIIRHLGLHIHLHKLYLFDFSKVHIAPIWLRKLVWENEKKFKF